MAPENHLYYGDNLTILRDRIANESVDLIYLDPPFNSNATYNVLFKSHDGTAAAAQIQAFDDTWHWNQQTEKLFLSMIGGGCPPRVADALTAMRNLLGTSDMNAYLVMMTARLVELHRVLKPTGSLYLHCDPTASHYLKIMLDAVFGPERFGAEIIWKRTTAHSDSKQGRALPGHIHDVLLLYTKTDAWTWNPAFVAYDATYIESHYRFVEESTGRRFRKADLTAAKPGGDTSYEWKGVTPYKGRFWAYSRENMEKFEAEGRLIYTRTGMPELKRYLDEMPGVSLQDLWTDIDPINARAAERLGYPTQKPLALLERILAASSNEGDVVLDPFCGCGTTIDAAEKLHRRWIGIDVTYLAVDLIRKRLRHTYGDEIETAYQVHGVPADLEGARALFEENPFDFERWAVSLIDAQPNEKQVGDRGIDGRVRFHADDKRIGQAVVSVKGGATVNPGMVRDLRGTVEREGAELGVLITLSEATRGMVEEADRSGTYTADLTGQTYPKIQLLTVGQLMGGIKPKMPTAILPYMKAKPHDPDQGTLDL
jgi:DNA modification methylase